MNLYQELLARSAVWLNNLYGQDGAKAILQITKKNMHRARRCVNVAYKQRVIDRCRLLIQKRILEQTKRVMNEQGIDAIGRAIMIEVSLSPIWPKEMA